MAHRDGEVAKGIAEDPLVARSHEGEEQANRHGFRLSGTHLPGNSAGLPLRQRAQRASSRVDAFVGSQAHLRIDRRRRPCDVEVVQVRTVLAADDQQVFEARRRHEYRAGPFSLKDRVGGDRRPVGHVAGPELPHPVDDRAGGIGRRRNLGRHDLAAAEPDEVREGPADIHAHVHGRPDCPRPQETSRG